MNSSSISARFRQLGDLAGTIGELTLAFSPWVPTTGPSAVADVTPEYLTTVLGTDHAGARVEACERLGGSTGTTDRVRLGLTWNPIGAAAGLPNRVFVKSTPLSAKNRAMVGPLKMGVNEVRFYGSARSELDAIAPIAYAASSSLGGRFLLVLEDLTLRGCQPFSLSDEVGLDHLQGVVRCLASLHATFWGSPRFAGDLAWVAIESRRPAHGLLTSLHRRARRRFLDGRESVDGPVQRLAAELTGNEQAIIMRREQGPQTLLHGDCHLGNTYRLADSQSGLLDWQIVHRGSGLREIAYFLGSGAPVALRRTHERDLLKLYLESLRERGVRNTPTFSQAWEQYRFWISYAWDAVQLTRTWPGLQVQANMDASWERVNAAVRDLEVADAVRSAIAAHSPGV